MLKLGAKLGSVALEWVDCRTPLGTATETAAALLAGRIALKQCPFLSQGEADPVPLALFSPLAEQTPPRVLRRLEAFLASLPQERWGTAAYPVIVASSNFGVGSLLEFSRDGDESHRPFATPHASVARLCEAAGWGSDVMIISHACVSAQLGLVEAARRLAMGAEKVLVFAYDLLSDFVTGGFHALKILNGFSPAPYMEREVGAIGLGDGFAAAVLSGARQAEWRIIAQSTWNEMFHMTSNDSSGSGFKEVLSPLQKSLAGRRVWLKGHGTGTLEAGRLEAEETLALFGPSPLVSWKGSLGHTLGSCALVELAIALEAMRAGMVPGTLHGGELSPTMTSNVATEPFAAGDFDGFLLLSNAFGGAHAGALICHD